MWRSLRYLTTGLIAVGVACVLAGSAPAQEIAQTYEFQPKDDAAFEAALEKHAEDRMEEGDPWTWNVWEEIAGPNTGTYIVRSGGHSWGDFDTYNENFGGEAALHFEADVTSTIETTHSWIGRFDTALSRPPNDGDRVRFAEVVTYHIEPGKQAQFDDAVEQIHSAIVAADWPARYSFVDPMMGKKGPQKVGAFFFEDFADMQEPETPFMEMMGSEMGEEKAEKILEQMSSAIRSTETQLFVYRPELSVEPAEEMGGDGR